ncbi:MAG: SurA N-terminal domain-containing protein [Chloroflexi bacterium]|nr:SurA N-terminal domain-containing protein [Chloroflexota bacterium]
MSTDRRHRASRNQRDVKKRRLALGLIGLMLLAIASIAIAGYVVIFVLPSRELIVQVNDVTYTRGDMVKLIRINQKGAEFLGGQFDATNDIFQTLQTFVENEIIAQSAPGLGISVSDEEIDREVRRIFAPRGASADTLDSAQSEREFKESYSSYLNAIQYSEDEHRQLTRRSILREKVRLFIGESVPNVGEQVHLHRLVMLPDDEIDIMLVKLKDFIGDAKDPESLQDAFKAVVREFSRDSPELVRTGGDLGWVPRGVVDDYERIFFSLEVGEISELIPSVDNTREFFFFFVSEKDSARELTPASIDALKTKALQDWINEQRGKFDVYSKFNSEIYSWMLEQLGLTAAPQPEQPQQPLSPFGN